MWKAKRRWEDEGVVDSDPTATRQLEYPAGYKVVVVVVRSAYIEDDVATPSCTVMGLPLLSWSLDNLATFRCFGG